MYVQGVCLAERVFFISFSKVIIVLLLLLNIYTWQIYYIEVYYTDIA